ncbi:MAG: M3 family oligoendopeptidase [Candidatus Schekmanbacteria bacterium]|nr:M3 family oligoendopeptidase [Candidatus Schekmanbacteria bacterium]
MNASADWDMTPYFQELGDSEYDRFWTAIEDDLRRLIAMAAALPALGEPALGSWSPFLAELQELAMRIGHLSSYLACLRAADGTDERIAGEAARFAIVEAEHAKLYVRLRARLAAAGDSDYEQVVRHPALAAIADWFRRNRLAAQFSMPIEHEDLVADLEVVGLTAWSRLYDKISATLTFALQVPGETAREVPISLTTALLADKDPAVRRASLAGANRAWASMGESAAACLNGIAGARLLLHERRGEQHFLDPALRSAGIRRDTLDALMAVVREAQPLMRQYLKDKARVLRLARLGIQDLTAPAGQETLEKVPWAAATDRLCRCFDRFDPELGTFARHAISHRWIDYQPRPRKQPGAFCSTSGLLGQSRVFMTFNGSTPDLMTLAHELGHGYHNWLLRDRQVFARRYPIGLAETASTFCEQILVEQLLADAESPPQRLRLLDERLLDAVVFLLGVPARFHFEHAFYEARKHGEVSVSRLQELVLKAQEEAFADALDREQLDAWLWASKLHFYLPSISFYNFPYIFGYLLTRGLFARARAEGAAFLPCYRALLRDSGSAETEAVVRRHVGADLTRPDFWRASVAEVAAECEAFRRTSEQCA